MYHPKHHARKNPEKTAYIFANTDRHVSYRELDQWSSKIANVLRQCGLKPGDHLAFQMENHLMFFPVVWAAQRAGIVFTPVHSHLKKKEVEYIINNCGAKVFITTDKFHDVAESLDKDALTPGHYFMFGDNIDGFESMDDAMGKASEEAPEEPVAGLAMLYSSGTTGQPKGIKPAWEDRAIDEIQPSGFGLAAFMGISEDSTYMAPAPLYHAAPLHTNILALAMGGTVVIMEKFDPELALRCIERYKVTHSQWVPIMFIRMLKLPEELRKSIDISSLQNAVHSAAPCPPDVKYKMIDWFGPIIMEYYSASEGMGLTALGSEEWLAHPGSVGLALMGDLHIGDEEGNELPPGEIGTIYFSGLDDFEYHNEPEKTASAHNNKGWATVGDLGYVDEEGYLFLADRKDFMIISGGVNIYPKEIENLLITHDKVADVAVFGIPDEEFGESVKAVVQPADDVKGNAALEQELIAWCKENLSSVKAPRSIDFDPNLPRMDNGKLYKKQVRARYL